MIFFLCRFKVFCNNGSPICISIHYLNGGEPDTARKQELHTTLSVCELCVYTYVLSLWVKILLPIEEDGKLRILETVFHRIPNMP